MRLIHTTIAFAALAFSPFLIVSARGDSASAGPFPNPATNMYGGYCAPTAVANSLAYLQQKYPQVYGTSLVPDGNDPGSVAAVRGNPPLNAQGAPTNGTNNGPIVTPASGIIGMETLNATRTAPATNATMWNSKVNYINSVAPNTTTFAAQVAPTNSTAGFVTGANISIQNVVPTVQFLLNQLKTGEDVEIAFAGVVPVQQQANGPPRDAPTETEADQVTNEEMSDDTDQEVEFGNDTAVPTARPNANQATMSISHMVTLASIDTTAMTLSFLDPNNPGDGNVSGAGVGSPGLGDTFSSGYTIDANGYINFNWMNGGANTPVNGVYIWEAWAESPVPLPESIQTTVFLLALCGIRYFRRAGSRRNWPDGPEI